MIDLVRFFVRSWLQVVDKLKFVVHLTGPFLPKGMLGKNFDDSVEASTDPATASGTDFLRCAFFHSAKAYRATFHTAQPETLLKYVQIDIARGGTSFASLILKTQMGFFPLVVLRHLRNRRHHGTVSGFIRGRSTDRPLGVLYESQGIDDPQTRYLHH